MKRKKKVKGYWNRDKWFTASPLWFPLYPYPSRLVIGVNLNDFRGRNAPYFNFRVGDKIYSMSREKAFELGMKYALPSNFIMPHLLPKEEFKVIEEGLPERIQWEFDEKTNTAYPKGTMPVSDPFVPVQQSFI